MTDSKADARRHPFDALTYRDFRLHWGGSPVSVISGGVAALLATGLIALRVTSLRRYVDGDDGLQEASARSG